MVSSLVGDHLGILCLVGFPFVFFKYKDFVPHWKHQFSFEIFFLIFKYKLFEAVLNRIFEGNIFVSLECQQCWLELYILISASLIFVGVMFFEVSKNKTLQNYPPYCIDFYHFCCWLEVLFSPHILMSTTIPHWKHQFSSDHWSKAVLGRVSTLVGDHLGILCFVDSSFKFWTFYN